MFIISAPSITVGSGSVLIPHFSIRNIFIITGVEEIFKRVNSSSIEYVGLSEHSGLNSWIVDDNGLYIYLDEKSILRLECIANCFTNVGIEIGDSLEDVVSVLGKPNTSDTNYINYKFCGEDFCADSFLYFYFSKNKLEKIMYWIAYV